MFEKEEAGHGGDRIVRIGTHTGANKLESRLNEHFVNENKDRSIFRKNIGRCFLNQDQDPYARIWEIDFTSHAAATSNHLRNRQYELSIEKRITEYMQTKFSFSVIPVQERETRLVLESGLIATVAQCGVCTSSPKWLGRFSSKPKIVESGLWQVQHLNGMPLCEKEVEGFFI
jgi:hypothetical protein